MKNNSKFVDLETDKLRFNTMKRLLEELWLHSNNCTESIEHIWYPLQEVAKSTSNSRSVIKSCLTLLIDNGYIRNTSSKPLLYEFTELGKRIKTDSDIEKIIENIA